MSTFTRGLLSLLSLVIAIAALAVVITRPLQGPAGTAPPGPAPAAHPPAQGKEWHATKVRVDLIKVSPEHVRGKLLGDQVPVLLIRLKITNLSPTRRLDYDGFEGQFRAFLRDEHGNRYQHLFDPIGDLNSRIRIDPLQSHVDGLIFEGPVAAATELQLALNAAAWGDTGVAQFRFPVPAPTPKK
jgi:hypothetical protein